MSAASLACGLLLVPRRQRGLRSQNGTKRARALLETRPFTQASGGTVTEFTDASGRRRRVHTFSNNSTLQVSLSLRPADIVVAGGGGGGGGEGNYYARGGNGGAGTASQTSQVLPPSSLPVVVGAGGSCCAPRLNSGPGGGGSSFAGITQAGGGGGAPGASFAPGSPNGPQIVSSIDGTSKTYGGGGGRGWADPDWVAYGGGPGAVVVAYEIAA